MDRDALSTPALEALLQAPSLAILAVDKQGNVILWNPSAERMFGWTESQVLGHLLPNVPESQRQSIFDRIQSALKGETIKPLDAHRLRKDGSPIDVSVWTAPLRDSEGNFIGVGLRQGYILAGSDGTCSKPTGQPYREPRQRRKILRASAGKASAT